MATSLEARRAAARAKARRYAAMLTDEEDAAIRAAAASDPDNPELTEEELSRMRPVAEVAPELIALARRSRGRQRAPTKRLVSLRVDPDVLDHFRATGPGWQGRMNAALRKAAGL